jgi:hypothetical protein
MWSVLMAQDLAKGTDTGQKTLPSIQALSDELSNTPRGAIQDAARDKIIGLLAHCWHDLQGADETSMKDCKLTRAEDLSWMPPVLSFTIERHGATVLGSTRAELDEWTVNLNLMTASCARSGYRQLTLAAPRLDVKPIAARVCDAVQQGQASNCELVGQGIVAWHGSDHVSIKHGALIPSDGYQQTIKGRRLRFRNELTNMMEALGWKLERVGKSLKFRKI